MSQWYSGEDGKLETPVFLPPTEDKFTFPDTAGSPSAPVAIPGGGTRRPWQRHTNFTPPRSYLVANPTAANIVRSASASSLSTAVSVLVAEHMHPGSLRGCLTESRSRQFEHSPYAMSVSLTTANLHGRDALDPTINGELRCAMEQEIGRELRNISDSFHLECSGFRDGYDLARSAARAYSSSFPGCINRVGRSADWQNVVTSISPHQRLQFPV